MDGACCTYGKQERCTQKSLVGHIRERDHLEEVGVYEGNNIKKGSLRNGSGMDSCGLG